MADRLGGDNAVPVWVDGNKMRAQTGYAYNPQEGPTYTVGSMLVTIKTSGAETDGRYSLVEVTVPPYYTGIWPHFHEQTSEAIYLTHGMLAVTLGEETMVVRQGSFVLVPPNQPHRVWNPAATQATFLAYFSPAGAEGFFAALAEMELPEGTQSAGVASDVVPDLAAAVWAVGKTFDYFPAV
jgi:quercetin dioxygenase-like cupin family protein